jgi:corrinoid protein of di/trimethylamine methyltransferase
MNHELIHKINLSLVEGQLDIIEELVQAALDSNIEPMVIINQGLMIGMQVVGKRFQEGEYFLPHVMIAAEAMKKAMMVLEPLLLATNQAIHAGTVVIGTVQGDIHEIGKNLVATMLSANGFKVVDLGVDVAIDKFIYKAEEVKADVIGLSALLTTTMTVQRDCIEALRQKGLRDKIKILVGGAPVNAEWARSIGADGYAEDAMAAVRLVKSLIKIDTSS